MDLITSFFEGRLRLRAEIFMDEDVSKDIASLLNSVKGVENFKVNSSTGSLLIEYDPIKLPFIKLKKAMPILENLKAMYESGAAYGDIRKKLAELKTIFQS